MKPFGFTVIFCLVLTACGENDSAPLDNGTNRAVDDQVKVLDNSLVTPDPPPENPVEKIQARTAIIGASEIPYPVYPNGSKYRVGDEHGLRVVLYQTEDSFEAVDSYYRDKAGDVGMPRLAAMSDYVRYASSEDDLDPWETTRPGIVIHQFNNDRERAAVGADQRARTNIIMSF